MIFNLTEGGLINCGNECVIDYCNPLVGRGVLPVLGKAGYFGDILAM